MSRMVAFVCGGFGGIQQTSRFASARRTEHVGTSLSISAYALIAAMLGACASTAAPPGPPPNRFAAKYDPITSTAAISCATSVSIVGKTANQSPIHPGMYGSRNAIGVVGIH